MRSRSLLPAVAVVLTAWACTDATSPAAPSTSAPPPSFAIEPGGVCDGAAMPVAECEALVALYNGTNGPGWTRADHWGDPNPCTWFGVTCSAGDHGSAIELDVRTNGLVGPIPPELGDLTSLTALFLPFNELTGPIPDALQNLTALAALGLSSNQITGSIPTWLGGLTDLEEVHLGANPITGPIPAELGSLSNLVSLSLYATDLSGPIPPELGGLVSLEYLWIANNEVSGAIPPEIGSLPNLKRLLLVDTELSGPIPPELGNLGTVSHIRLAMSGFSGHIPAELANLTADTLYLYGNDLTGLVPLAFMQAHGEKPYCELTSIFHEGNEGLYVPDTQAYRDADVDGDGELCSVPLSSPEDIGDDAAGVVGELVPDPISEGQANALLSKIENALEKAAKGQYQAAINQMQAFLNQVAAMVADGTLTAEQAAPLVELAESMIAVWTELL